MTTPSQPVAQPVLRITRRLEFDAGHRIPDHGSQCRNMHGHRYVLELTVEGGVISQAGRSDTGMVMDFSDIKAIAKEYLVDLWDHAFLVYAGDTPVRRFLESLPNHKTVIIDCVPTAENLARVAFETLVGHFHDRYGNGLRLVHVRLYETPNSWADYGV